MLSAIVLYELRVGIAKSTHPEKRLQQMRELLDVVTFVPFAEPETTVAARIRAELERAGTPIGPLDVLIAATALHHSAILVTRNTAEFSRIPSLLLADWY